MPSVSTVIPETYETITRPIAVGVVRDLAKKLGMSPDLRINFPGFAEQVAQPGSNLTYSPMGNNYWPNSDKIFVDVTETAREQSALATPVFRPDNSLCFHDPRVHTLIKPVYTPTEMVLALRYRAPDRVTAERWRDDIRTRYNRGRVENLHELSYCYQIPYVFLLILQEIGTLKEKVAPYGESLLEWVQKYISPNATTVTDLAGNNPLLTIAETQKRILGWFDFDFEPDPVQKDNETGACTVSFQYHIDYDKVVECVMSYPLVVNNQVVSSRFRDTNKPYTLNDTQSSLSMSRSYFDALTPGVRQSYLPSMPWLKVPSFDDWQPPAWRKTVTTLATFMILVDGANPKALLDLADLGDYALDPDISKLIETEGPYLGMFGQSIFHFGLFEEYTPLPDGHLTWDTAFNLGFDTPLDLRERYHLRWGVVNDLSLLSQAALERFGNNPAAVVKVLTAMGGGQDPCVRMTPIPEPIDGKIYPEQLLKYAAQINQCRAKRVRVTTNSVFPLTVGNFLINARPATAQA